MSAENTANDAIETVFGSEKTAWFVSVSSTATGIASSLADWQPLLSFGATAMGVLLSFVLAVKHITLLYWQFKDRQHGHARKDDPPIDEEK